MNEKERLDVILFTKKLAPSREAAKAMIMAGNVFVNGQREDKPGVKILFKDDIFVKETMKYVSRGGYKLEKALAQFRIELENKICLDIGASTGGFTDCMLQNGAKKVYAIDVGYGQLAWKLRKDEKVVCMEKKNIRYITPPDVSDLGDFASIDVSFISLTKVLQPVCHLLNAEGEIVCLIKPQFEAGRENVGKKGVVKDKKIHLDVAAKVVAFVEKMGLCAAGFSYSPIKGPEGNIEYLLHISKQNARALNIWETIECAHEELMSK